MESLDFSALLLNMLDNAIESCEGETFPEIDVAISQRRDYETILVKNKIGTSVLDVNPELLTTKSDGSAHGMGILQIRSITAKYGCMCGFYEEDGFFAPVRLSLYKCRLSQSLAKPVCRGYTFLMVVV